MLFVTQVKSQCNTRPGTSVTHGQRTRIQLQDSYQNLQKKLKITKQHAKKIKIQFNSIQSNVNHIRKSVDLCRHQTGKKKLYLVKNFMAFKVKAENNQLVAYQKTLEFQRIKQKKQQNKIARLNNELHRAVIKYQDQRSKQYLQLQNRTQRKILKQQLQHNRSMIDSQSKKKYEKIKIHSRNLQQNKNKILSYKLMKAHQNYKQKIQNQKQIIQTYHNMLKDVQDIQRFDSIFQTRQITINDDQQIFFVTDR